MLKLTHSHSVHDATDRAQDIEEAMWYRLVAEVGDLHVLAGELKPLRRPSEAQVRHLAEFWRNQYQAVFVDLSGDLDPASIEILQESKQIFLVCTAETVALHLAREKYICLKTMGLGDQVKLIVNRYCQDGILSTKQIEATLGVPIQAVIPNDYPRVQYALQCARGVESSSAIGKEFAALAAAITGKSLPQPASESRGKHLLEWFSSKRGRVAVDLESAQVPVIDSAV